MTQSPKPQFAPVLRALLKDDAQVMDHATPEQLVDHHFGRLSREEADLLDRHLRGCPECAQLSRDLAEFEDFVPASTAEALADLDAQAAWRRLQVRFGEQSAPVRQPRPVPIEAGRRKPKSEDFAMPRLRARPRSDLLIAASLLAGVLGLGTWVGLLETKVRELSKPTVNVAMLELHTDAVRSAGTERPVVNSGGDSVVFLLESPESQPSAGFRAEIRKAGVAEPLAKAGGLYKIESTGTLNLQVSRSLLAPGDYQIDLFGEGAAPLVTYEFRVSSP